MCRHLCLPKDVDEFFDDQRSFIVRYNNM